MRVIMLAPPGAGKGTQGERIAGRYGVPHISSGDLFRDEVARKTPLGNQLRGYLGDPIRILGAQAACHAHQGKLAP